MNDMEHYRQQIEDISSKGLTRTLNAVELHDNGYCNYKGRRLLNLSSNDYLGLATNDQLKQEFHMLLGNHPEWLQFGASSSRLLTGNTALYEETEACLKSNYNSQAALFFNSGYHANIGILPALSDKKDLIVADKLCHASLIDGMRLSDADFMRYRHCDYQHVKDILEKKRALYRHVFIVTESVFSMDGDEADLNELAEIKEAYDAILYVDEAHSVGVKGEKGLGSCEEQKVTDRIDILVGTLGKAYASVGAFAIFNSTIKQVLINKARTLLFTTALPPINMAWSKLIIERMAGFSAERKQLKALSSQLSADLVAIEQNVEPSHIVPIMLGDNAVAIQLSEHLMKQGFLVYPIRPPTVPKNTARLRLSLTANINSQDLRSLVACLQNALTL